jgi:hypothetical protein
MGTSNKVPPEALPRDETLSDEEVRRRVWEDPAARARIQDLIDYMRSARSRGTPGISAEELPDFLREHG